MRHSIVLQIVIASYLAIAFAACDKQNDSPEQGAESQAPTAPPGSSAADLAHAPQGFRPGSHEDWCGAHQVPESLCTRCNPSLVPAFKATGDWCDEHGLPESQCLKCNPDLKIERPRRAEQASP